LNSLSARRIKEPNYVSQIDLTLRGDIKEGGGARVELLDRDRIAVSAA
jgi:hypothetical protein